MSSLGMNEMGTNPPIIDDSNYSFFVNEITDPATPFNGGFDFEKVVEGFGNPFSRDLIPSSDWDDHIARQESDKSSPDHWRLAGGVPVLDQNGFGYCWCYGTVGAIMNCYAQTGMLAPHLSAMGPAWQGKRGRNVGGWAGEALEYIAKFGIPELSVWPEHDNRVNPNDEAVKRSAAMHGVVDSEELRRNDFAALMSALLDPERPTPVTLGLQWWGHLVYATKAVRISQGKYGVKIVNSWKPSWGKQGTAILERNKATAFEQIAIVDVKPRSATTV